MRTLPNGRAVWEMVMVPRTLLVAPNTTAMAAPSTMVGGLGPPGAARAVVMCTPRVSSHQRRARR